MNGNGSLLSALKCAAVAILLAACGAWSSSVLLPSFPGRFDLFFPIPFAVLCTLLFMRTKIAPLAAFLMCFVWYLALLVANFVGMGRHDYRLPGCVGSLVGAIGLLLCAAISNRSLFSIKHFVIGALIASIAGLSFASWTQMYYAFDLNRGPAGAPPPPIHAFAIWQAMIGTYLYALCTQVISKEVAQPAVGTSTKY